MSFDPARAIHVHAHGARSIAIETVTLAEEDALLIHSVSFSADRQVKVRELDADGTLIFRADADPVLSWQVRATVLEWRGLADAHPGPLSREALVFANSQRGGNRYPHQFRRQIDGDDVGILFYESPSTDHEGGDTSEISFRIALEFSDLHTDTDEAWTTQVTGWTEPEPTLESDEYLAFLAAYPVDPPEGGPDGSADPRSYGWRPGWLFDAGDTDFLATGPGTMFYLDSSVDVDGLTVTVWAEDDDGNHTESTPTDETTVSGNSFTVTVPADGRYTLFLHTIA